MVSREAEKEFAQRIVLKLVAEKQMSKIGDLLDSRDLLVKVV